MKRSQSSIVPSRAFGVSALGIIGTLLLHCLLFLPLVLDLGLPPHVLPNRSGAGASVATSNREPMLTVVFINEATETPHIATIDPTELASHGIAAKDFPILVFSPDRLFATNVDPNSQNNVTAAAVIGDQAQHALLFGRYLGQVQARIDRAWQRPRTDIGTKHFSCRAKIVQDRHGSVVGVNLDQCNGSARWRQSLFIAIRSASPLPAPPDPSVYADLLNLNFESDGYKAGGSEDGFESVARSILVGDRARESFEHFVGEPAKNPTSNGKSDSGVIHLTIIGTPTDRFAPTAPPVESPLPVDQSAAQE